MEPCYEKVTRTDHPTCPEQRLMLRALKTIPNLFVCCVVFTGCRMVHLGSALTAEQSEGKTFSEWEFAALRNCPNRYEGRQMEMSFQKNIRVLFVPLQCPDTAFVYIEVTEPCGSRSSNEFCLFGGSGVMLLQSERKSLNMVVIKTLCSV